jgi:catechol 2,3-dioxygenase-like lactoylglutathione lyase family enzyme
MRILSITPQLRTTDLDASIRFYTEKLGFSVEFQFEGFYAGIRAGNASFHLKLVDDPDPSIPFVVEGEHLHLYFGVEDAVAAAAELKQRGVPLTQEVRDTEWGTREFALRDDQGHTLYFGQRL